MAIQFFCTIDHAGNVVQRDLDIEHAAYAILTYDGSEYQLRASAKSGFDLWISDRAGQMIKSIFWSKREDVAEAWSDIARDVVRSGVFKLDAQDQESFDAEQAQLAVEAQS